MIISTKIAIFKFLLLALFFNSIKIFKKIIDLKVKKQKHQNIQSVTNGMNMKQQKQYA